MWSLWQGTNCQDSKLASKFFHPHQNQLQLCSCKLLNFVTILVEKPFLVWTSVAHCWKDLRSKGMKNQDVKKMFHIVGTFTVWKNLLCCQIFEKRTSTRFCFFLSAHKPSILQHDFSPVQTSELLEGQKHYGFINGRSKLERPLM